MPDIDKVLKGLECCKTDEYKCGKCPYADDDADGGCYSVVLRQDAWELLKAQEPVEPKRILSKCGGMTVPQYRCGICEGTLFVGAKYCPECGRKVKWG